MTKVANYPQHLKLWDIFYDFTQTPRPSKKEEKIQAYLIRVAKEKDLRFVKDQAGNIIIYVPGKNGLEDAPPIIIQNHMDMVTDVEKGFSFDFENDPLKLKVEDGQLKADKTTLGADNGIGCAAALALIYEESLSHPPLELLFTTDEETGLNGALGLESNYLSAKRMLNLDTEEWGSLYIGCAGGIDYELIGHYDLQVDNNKYHYEIALEGLSGGHSGIDIHRQKANAIKALNQLLTRLNKDIHLVSFSSGVAHNIIPRDSVVTFSSVVDISEYLSSELDKLESEFHSYFQKDDKGFIFTLSQIEPVAQSFSIENSQKLINLLNLFPHGAHRYDLESAGELVSTSNNLSKVFFKEGNIYIQSSLRFLDRDEIKPLEYTLEVLSNMFSLKLKKCSEYPSWKPNRDARLLAKVGHIFSKTFHTDPKVTAIHAGLECGILKEKIGDIDVISFGPTIKGAHTPDERVDIRSVDQFWKFLVEILKELA